MGVRLVGDPPLPPGVYSMIHAITFDPAGGAVLGSALLLAESLLLGCKGEPPGEAVEA
jgi:hypothetical protein